MKQYVVKWREQLGHGPWVQHRRCVEDAEDMIYLVNQLWAAGIYEHTVTKFRP